MALSSLTSIYDAWMTFDLTVILVILSFNWLGNNSKTTPRWPQDDWQFYTRHKYNRYFWHQIAFQMPFEVMPMQQNRYKSQLTLYFDYDLTFHNCVFLLRHVMTSTHSVPTCNLSINLQMLSCLHCGHHIENLCHTSLYHTKEDLIILWQEVDGPLNCGRSVIQPCCECRVMLALFLPWKGHSFCTAISCSCYINLTHLQLVSSLWGLIFPETTQRQHGLVTKGENHINYAWWQLANSQSTNVNSMEILHSPTSR